jgi:hypothetical protein
MRRWSYIRRNTMDRCTAISKANRRSLMARQCSSHANHHRNSALDRVSTVDVDERRHAVQMYACTLRTVHPQQLILSPKFPRNLTHTPLPLPSVSPGLPPACCTICTHHRHHRQAQDHFLRNQQARHDTSLLIYGQFHAFKSPVDPPPPDLRSILPSPYLCVTKRCRQGPYHFSTSSAKSPQTRPAALVSEDSLARHPVHH